MLYLTNTSSVSLSARKKKLHYYHSYLKGEITREQLYINAPEAVHNSVINAAIGNDNKTIFRQIDELKGNAEVDLILGGPPCQAYSYIGRAALKHKESDERTTLYIQYGRFLQKYKPKLFVFENVPGLKTAAEGKYYKNLKKHFRRLGYIVNDKPINALDLGVIQKRQRLIIIGWRKDIPFSYPEFETIQHCWNRDTIFSDLPAITSGHVERYCSYAGDTNEYLEQSGIRNGLDYVTQHITRPHNSKDLTIYKRAIALLKQENKRLKNNDIPEEERTQKNVTDFLDRFKVVDTIPHTMIAHIAKDGHHFIHHDLKQLRSISIREAARIQSFPDDYYFEGIKEKQPRTAAFRQIGNAVPPLLSNAIAKAIGNYFNL